jgi:archaellum component FlaC
METRSSARAERNGYITMFDTSMSRADDGSVDARQVMRERVERLEEEGERVNGELNVCRRELKERCKEVALLKKKITLLEKQTKDLDAYKKLNKMKSQEIEQKNISISELLKEIESSGREREALVESFKKGNHDLLEKLREAENSNSILRRNFDDLFERLEGQRDGGTGRCAGPEIVTHRSEPRKQTNEISVMADEHLRERERTGNEQRTRYNVHIVGDQLCKGVGVRLRERMGNGRILCTVRPGAKITHFLTDIDKTLDGAKDEDTILIVTGNNESGKDLSKYNYHIRNIIRKASKSKPTVYITTIKYSSVEATHLNECIYKANIELYKLAQETSNVHIIDVNYHHKRSALLELFIFSINFTHRRFHNNIDVLERQSRHKKTTTLLDEEMGAVTGSNLSFLCGGPRKQKPLPRQTQKK